MAVIFFDHIWIAGHEFDVTGALQIVEAGWQATCSQETQYGSQEGGLVGVAKELLEARKRVPLRMSDSRTDLIRLSGEALVVGINPAAGSVLVTLAGTGPLTAAD